MAICVTLASTVLRCEQNKYEADTVELKEWTHELRRGGDR